MKNKIISLIVRLILLIICGICFIHSIHNKIDIIYLILIGMCTTHLLYCTILNILEIIEMMEPVFLRCPKCNKKILFKNWLDWVLHSPIYWFGKRYTKCHCCKQRSWMEEDK